MKAEAIVSSTCWAAAATSRSTSPDSLGTCFWVSIVALSSTHNDGTLSLFQRVFLDSSGHVCISLIHQRRHLSRCLKVSWRCQSKSLGAQSPEYDTATSYCSSAASPQSSPGQILEACQDQAKWDRSHTAPSCHLQPTWTLHAWPLTSSTAKAAHSAKTPTEGDGH